MPAPIDFGAIVSELANFQSEAAKMCATLKSAKQREVIGDMLTRLQSAKADVERLYPETMDFIEKDARNTIAEAESQQAEAAQLKEKLNTLAAGQQAAASAAPKAAPKPPTPVDPGLGGRLREELLERFGPLANLNVQTLEDNVREVWQDWKWDGAK